MSKQKKIYTHIYTYNLTIIISENTGISCFLG